MASNQPRNPRDDRTGPDEDRPRKPRTQRKGHDRIVRPSAQEPPVEPLKGKVALVTGGSRRVGKAIALALAQAGMDVAITYQRSGGDAGEVVRRIERLGRRALAIPADLAEANAADFIHDAFIAHFDRCDALINNASIFDRTPIGSITLEAIEQQFAVNARAPVMLMQKFAPMLAAHAVVDTKADPSRRKPVQDAGRIVNFIDIHVMGQPLRGYMAYNMSKAALQEATMTAAMELAPKVTVNAIAPGVVAWAESYKPAQRKAYMKRVPLGRPGTPEDAAAAVLFLVRDADYCTGQIIRLDGGRLYT
ncbi:MAG: SDR family oxidoreductase [Phycisphaeraceae bacterium]